MIRLALIGCGGHSRQQHAAPLARYAADHPKAVRLVAACDLDRARAERVCDEFGFAHAYSDLNEMLEREHPDGCVCIVPVPSIVELGAELFRRGIPCVIEKPPGVSLEEAESLAEVARATGTPNMVSVNRRFIPLLNRGIAWARDRGPIFRVRVSLLRHGRREPEFVWSTGIHGIDAARHIVGEVAKWEASVHRTPGSATAWYTIRMTFANGCRGVVELAPTAGMVEESYELLGEGWRVQVVSTVWESVTLRCWRDGRLELETASRPDQPVFFNCGAYDEVVEFVGALKAGRSPRPDLEAVLPSARIGFEIAGRSAGTC
ncbi:MAG: Gfo/Idh/MocA family oxidoreductase [Kiritimatiellaeota bacterium]|nr:Gfo/Idh/MocA family oxidoreductase [Kiritimatiellota bacterium]